jgi:hypothetical protein
MDASSLMLSFPADTAAAAASADAHNQLMCGILLLPTGLLLHAVAVLRAAGWKCCTPPLSWLA